MYRGVSREGYMKSIAARSSTYNGVGSAPRTIVMIAMLIFAVSGLISGFAVGAFVGPKYITSSRLNQATTPVAQKTSTHTASGTIHPVAFGFPVIDTISNFEVADGTTVYTLSAHAVDQSIDKGHGKAVQAPDITCRLWLVDNTQNPDVPIERLKSSDTLANSPFPGEITGLVFDSTTPQTQTCNNGVGTWKYQVDTSVTPGGYYLVVLTDWQGAYYDWSWVVVTIKKQGS